MAEIKPDISIPIDGCPACIAFDPVHSSYFVVGTYNLETSTVSVDGEAVSEQRKSGHLFAYALSNKDRPQVYVGGSFCVADNWTSLLKQVLDLPSAAFDLLWTNDPQLLVVSLSNGSIGFYRWSRTTSLQLEVVAMKAVFEPSIGVTHLAYRPKTSPDSFAMLACSASTGETRLVGFKEHLEQRTDTLETAIGFQEYTDVVVKHDLEAWCAIFTRSSFSLFTGGDDSTLRLSDLSMVQAVEGPRTPASNEYVAGDAGPPLWLDKKSHTAGVTALALLPIGSDVDAETDDTFLLTGSYDETLRIYHTPTRKVVAEKRLDGGVWRLRFLPQQISTIMDQLSQSTTHNHSGWISGWPLYVVASCMQAGTRILRLQYITNAAPSLLGTWTIDLVAKLDGMDLNYGCDMFVGGSDPWAGGLKLVSISFYDKVLLLWRWRSTAGASPISTSKRNSSSVKGLPSTEILPEDSVSNDGKATQAGFVLPPPALAMTRLTEPLEQVKIETEGEVTDDEEVPMQIEPKNMGIL